MFQPSIFKCTRPTASSQKFNLESEPKLSGFAPSKSASSLRRAMILTPGCLGRGDDTLGNPHRAQISQFELFELVLLLKLDKQFSIEQFELTVSQSAVEQCNVSRIVSNNTPVL